jgi:cytoskeletal protein CcmA (bactofilin family)
LPREYKPEVQVNIMGNVKKIDSVKSDTTLEMTGHYLVEGDVEVEGRLYINGGLIIEGNLNTLDNIKITRSLEVQGNINTEGALEVGDYLECQGDITVKEWIESNNYIDTKGNITAGEWIVVKDFLRARKKVKTGRYLCLEGWILHAGKVETPYLHFYRDFYKERAFWASKPVLNEFAPIILDWHNCYKEIEEAIKQASMARELMEWPYWHPLEKMAVELFLKEAAQTEKKKSKKTSTKSLY